MTETFFIKFLLLPFTDHQFYHKWAPLTHPNKSSSQVQGYLKVDIAILEKGEFMRIPFFKGDTDFIQGYVS